MARRKGVSLGEMVLAMVLIAFLGVATNCREVAGDKSSAQTAPTAEVLEIDKADASTGQVGTEESGFNWWWVVGGVVVLAAIGSATKSQTCDVCGTAIKRKYHTWKLEGKNKKLCPNCNSQMERKVSKAAFDEKFG